MQGILESTRKLQQYPSIFYVPKFATQAWAEVSGLVVAVNRGRGHSLPPSLSLLSPWQFLHFSNVRMAKTRLCHVLPLSLVLKFFPLRLLPQISPAEKDPW